MTDWLTDWRLEIDLVYPNDWQWLGFKWLTVTTSVCLVAICTVTLWRCTVNRNWCGTGTSLIYWPTTYYNALRFATKHTIRSDGSVFAERKQHVSDFQCIYCFTVNVPRFITILNHLFWHQEKILLLEFLWFELELGHKSLLVVMKMTVTSQNCEWRDDDDAWIWLDSWLRKIRSTTSLWLWAQKYKKKRKTVTWSAHK